MFNMKDTEGMTALDKFKIRLVHDLARRLYQEKKSEDETFEQLSNEYSCDCKMLWDRMKSLTLKKLKRLLAAEDRNDYIPKIARMTAIDWLTFDLVLVHEKLDVIGEDKIAAGRTEPTVHSLLFDLVGKYDIEGLVERDSTEPKHLVEAWFALTKEYNTGGRDCSPMLLQRRWYQLKESTRIRMYAFWKNYRGNPELYEKAVEMKPTQLQISIAEKYPFVVTDTFEEWKELVKYKKVLLASAFEIKRGKELNNSNNDGESDPTMIEPNVDNMEVDGCSDSEEGNKETTNSDTESTVKEEVELKMELNDSIDIEESELNIRVPIENEHIDPDQDEKEFETTEEETDILLPKITIVMGRVMLPESYLEKMPLEENISTIVENDEKLCGDNDYVQIINPATEDSIPIDKISTTDNVNLTDVQNNVQIRTIDSNPPVENLPNSLQLVDDGIEFMDADYEEEHKPLEKEDEENCEDTEENVTACTIDPKLIMFPITYTRKLDEMNEFKNASFLMVKGDDIIERALVESKPIFNKAVEKEQLDEEESDDHFKPIPRLKFSNWRLQKPKNRSYNPIQLSGNPDFNTSLKKLNDGFFSSERNRLLLNACKPLTIDLHKGFEDSFVDNTIYLETTDCPIVCENNASVILPAMAVQSLLDNTELEEQELLQIKKEKPEETEREPEQVNPEKENAEEIIQTESVVVKRNKIVKLPYTEKLYQNLLVAEVSPMLPENSNKPPVRLVSAFDPSPQTINSESDVISNKSFAVKDHEEFRSANVVNNNKTKLFFPKKTIIPKLKPTNTLPAWTKPISRGSPVTDEYLITNDALHKMICLLSGVEVTSLKAKQVLAKTAQRVNDKEMASNEEIQQDSTPIENFVAVDNDKIDLTDTNKRQKILTRVKRRKSIRTVSAKSGYCCWVRYRLQNENLDQKLRHLCLKSFCRCCCRKLLLDKILYERGSTEEILQISNIDIQTDLLSNTVTLQQLDDHNNMKNTGLTLSTTQVEAPVQSQSLNYTSLTTASLDGDDVITLTDDESQEESGLDIPSLKTRVISSETWARYANPEEKKSLNEKSTNLPSITVYNPPNNTDPIIVIDKNEANELEKIIAPTGLTLFTTQVEAPSIQAKSLNQTPLKAVSSQNVKLENEVLQAADDVITLMDDESQEESRRIPVFKTKVISTGSWAKYMNTNKKKSLNSPSRTVNNEINNTEPIIVIDEDESNEPEKHLANTGQILSKGVNHPDAQVDQGELAKVPEVLFSLWKYLAEQNNINRVVNSTIIPNDNTTG